MATGAEPRKGRLRTGWAMAPRAGPRDATIAHAQAWEAVPGMAHLRQGEGRIGTGERHGTDNTGLTRT
jgi:hypothetical protein